MMYINCLEREYEDTEKKFFFVEFCISRYGGYWHKIYFEEPVTEKTAIQTAETYLSEPIDEDYFHKIKTNIFPGTEFKDYKLRADILCSCKFIEEVNAITLNGKVGLTFSCGS